MSEIVRVAAIAAVVGLVPSLVRAEAPASAPTQQELAEQISQLRHQLDALQARADADARTKAATSTTDQVMKDAADRSSVPSLQATGVDFTAGVKNNRFVIQSADGAFLLSPNAQIQIRNTTNYRDNDENVAPSGSDTENGFELRRMKFGANGNVYSKKLKYNILVDVPRNSGTATLQFASVSYQFTDNWTVQGGQFKNPLGKEQIVSGGRQFAAERSLLSDLLIGGDNPVQGVGLIYTPKDSKFRFETALTDGTNQNNTNFRDNVATFNAAGVQTAVDTRPDWGVAGRVEYQVFGKNFAHYDDFSAHGAKEQVLVIGAAADFTQNGNYNLITYTADALYKNTNGLSLFGAVLGRTQQNVDTDATVAGENLQDFDDIGVVVQAGQILPKKWAKATWEVFGRYSITSLDEDSINSAVFDNDIHEITAGLNGYFQNHNLKFTVDVTYLPNGSPVTSDGNGVIQSTDDQFILRTQFQLLI